MIKAFEIPEFIFNKEKLKSVYLNNKGEWAMYGPNDKLSLHTQLIEENNDIITQHISQIKNYEKIIQNVKFFKTLFDAKVGPHRDKRNVAINIPVIMNVESYVEFYRENGTLVDPKLSIKDKELKSKAKYYKECEVTDKFVTTKAYCLDTSQIHGVINKSKEDRVILSISFKDEYDDFNLIKKMYADGELL